LSRHIVVCGGGTAGCVVAARLSEDPSTRVTLLEAGPDYPTLAEMPEQIRSMDFFGAAAGHDWGYAWEGHYATSGPAFALTEGEVPVLRGKVMGGSSAINGGTALRPQPSDFDRWVALGNDQWTWENVLPYLR
jgi:choline dehydrogenase